MHLLIYIFDNFDHLPHFLLLFNIFQYLTAVDIVYRDWRNLQRPQFSKRLFYSETISFLNKLNKLFVYFAIDFDIKLTFWISQLTKSLFKLLNGYPIIQFEVFLFTITFIKSNSSSWRYLDQVTKTDQMKVC